MNLLSRNSLAAALLSLLPVVELAAEDAWRFDFGHGSVASGFLQVDADTLYTRERGYGLEPGGQPASLDRSTSDPLTRDALVSQDAPFLFSVALPEGNYRVTVVLGDSGGTSDTTVKAETRRLMLEHITTAQGEHRRETFTVNIRRPSLAPPPANAPGLTAVQLNERERGVPHWDEKLTLEFNGPRACVAGLEITPAPESETQTIFLLGDSTVTDQPGEPAAGWGQMLPRFFGPKVAVANHAESGETIKSFIMEGRLAKVLDQVRPGDYLFVQFGHNDSKVQWPQTYADASSTFPAYLRVLIAEARQRNVIPVLVTSMHRRRFDKAGRVVDTHGGYPDAVRRVAVELHVPLIDLHNLSAAFYERLGPEGSAAAFTDGTHHTSYGGYQLAKLVVSEIQRQIPALAARLRSGSSPQPFLLDSPSDWRLPPSPAVMVQPPRGN